MSSRSPLLRRAAPLLLLLLLAALLLLPGPSMAGRGAAARAPAAGPHALGSYPGNERTEWTQGAIPAPPLAPVGMVYDTREGFFLAANESGPSYNTTTTWAYNGSWTQLHPSGVPNCGPYRTKSAVLSYDTTDGFALLLLESAQGTCAWGFAHYAWETLPAPPGATGFEAMSFDPLGHRFVLLAHHSSWEWVVGSASWTNLTSMGPQPPASVDPGLCFDGADNYTLFFGGSDPVTGNGTDATWALNGTHWSNLTDLARPYPPSFEVGAVPASPYDTAMAYDPVDGYVVLLHEAPRQIATMTWTFRHGAWTNATWRMPAEPPFGPGFLVTDPAAGGNLTFWSPTEGFWYFDHFGPLTLPGFAPSPPVIDLGQGTTFFATVGGGLAPFSYAYSAAPPGCSTGFPGPSFYCRPTSVGNFPLALNVTDAIGEWITGSTELVVHPPLAISLSASGPQADAGAPWRLTVTAANGTAPYHYNYSGLPTGCASADAATLSCVPIEGGAFGVNVTVTDAGGGRISRIFALTVLPHVGLSSFAASATNITYGENVTFTAAPFGGSGSYSVRYLGLPPGCSSANVTTLVCRPGQVGSYTVTCVVTDSLGQNASANATIHVAPAVLRSAASALPWSYIALGVALAAVLGAAVLLARRRSRSPPHDAPEGDPPDPGSAEP